MFLRQPLSTIFPSPLSLGLPSPTNLGKVPTPRFRSWPGFFTKPGQKQRVMGFSPALLQDNIPSVTELQISQSYTFLSQNSHGLVLGDALLTTCLEIRLLSSILEPPLSWVIMANIQWYNVNIFPTATYVHTQCLWISCINTSMHSI